MMKSRADTSKITLVTSKVCSSSYGIRPGELSNSSPIFYHLSLLFSDDGIKKILVQYGAVRVN